MNCKIYFNSQILSILARKLQWLDITTKSFGVDIFNWKQLLGETQIDLGLDSLDTEKF